jgi:phospholipid N-methyltransferase
MVASFINVLKESGHILQFSYGPLSPLCVKKLGLKKKRLGHILLNIPPATIWQYSREDKAPMRAHKRLGPKLQFKSKLGEIQ